MDINKKLIKILRTRKPSSLTDSILRFLYWNPPLGLLRYHICVSLKCPLFIRRVQGMRLAVNPILKGIHKDLLIHGSREPYSTHIFRKELKRGMTVIDIGANIGYYCLIESSIIGEEGIVYAVEPSYQNIKYLVLNLLLNSCKNVIVRTIAIGDKNGSVTFKIVEDAPNLSRVATSKDETKFKVAMKTLDSFVEEEKIGHVDFIRMDVEGFECRILRGARKVLSSHLPKLFIEIHPSMMTDYGDSIESFLQELSSHGYKVKYAVWEPLTPTYLKCYKPQENWLVIKGPLDPYEILTDNKLRNNFCRDWARLFLQR